MKKEVIIPTAGESINEVDILEWKVKNGDMVATDDVLVELETEKATLELRAPFSGVITLKFDSNTTVKVGAIVAEIDEQAGVKGQTENLASQPIAPEKSSASTSEPTANTNQKMEKVDILVPAAGESITEAEISNWIKSNGAIVQKDDVLLEVETEKASLEVRATISGKLTIITDSGVVKVGDKIGEIVSVNETKVGIQNTASPSSSDSTSSSSSGVRSDKHATPASRKLIQEQGLDLNQIEASGRGGRVMKEDVLKSLSQSKVSEPSKTAKPQSNNADGSGSFNIDNIPNPVRYQERTKMTRLRKTIAGKLVHAQQTAALLTTFNEVDMQAVMDIRKQYKEKFQKKHDVNLGFMSFFIKAVCAALADFPIINSMIDGEDIISNHYNDIGIAVSTPKGLIVPIIRDAQDKSFDQIEKIILDFAKRGKEGNISMDEMSGGTFTITNGGTFGSMLSTPIINYPQSAILGMHNIVQRPVAVDGEVVIRPVMYLALSYDHRIIDGSDAVRFLVKIKESLEDPHRLLINL